MQARIDLSDSPRVDLAHLPTPLEPMERLSTALGGPRLYIKRDDCTGLATGGNKTRKLEFLVGEALAQGASTLVSFGALQSNHVRQTAAAAAKVGLRCELVLTDVVRYREPAYERSGNLLLDGLLGARVHVVADAEQAAPLVRDLLESERRAGRGVYVIPVGGSSAVGALGYVECAREIGEQARALSLDLRALVHATSSAGTQAGLLAGFAAEESDVAVYGVNVYAADADEQRSTLVRLCNELTARLGCAGVSASAIRIDQSQYAPGYGIPTDAMREAVELVARHEGILLDPVYSGKAMAALIAMVRRGEFGADEAVLFLHTGGIPGLFAYRDALTAT